MGQRKVGIRRAVVLGIGAAFLWVGCGSSTGSGFGGSPDGGGGVGPGLDATTGQGDGGVKLGGDSASPKCVASTCADLNANCGFATDTKCGGVVPCGSCIAPALCGGGGVANQCGTGGGGQDGGSEDGCVKLTCASQSITCGSAGDGCGGTLSCGTCTSPQTCGGDPEKPGQCGCTGTCAQVPTCASGTTTLTGKVYDPAANYGLYDALVYVPNDVTDPGLQPFPAGITCGVCGAQAAGDPLVTTYTAPDGTFTLSGVPVGAAVPLIIQLGRWRRQFKVNVATACGANSVPDKTLAMPSTHLEGDLPRMAILTGSLDPVECVLRKIGIADSEFTDPGGAGYINFYLSNDPNAPSPTTQGSGARIDSATPGQAALFSATGGPGGGPQLNQYDMTILECEGYPETQAAAQQDALSTYAGAGGRIFASDFQYAWLYQNTGLAGSANWNGGHGGGGYSASGVIDQPPANPQGVAFEQWLEDVIPASVSGGAVPIYPAFTNTLSVTPPTQEWLHSSSSGADIPVHFTFNTPLNAPAANQCGRVTFSDWHAQIDLLAKNTTFPGVCTAGALTPQEAILEFMIFDLSACVQPYTPICTPRTCASQGIACGPAGDGCGNALSCGSCATGQTCGGGGSGKCGTTTTCTPETCASQHVQCGAAGDGCGNELQCGSCSTGEICGITTAGQCGTATTQ